MKNWMSYYVDANLCSLFHVLITSFCLFSHSFWWIPSVKCWCFGPGMLLGASWFDTVWADTVSNLILAFFFNNDWKLGRVTLHHEFELELTALLVSQSFIYSDVSLLVSSYLSICLDDFHSKVVSKIIIFYYWWGYQYPQSYQTRKKNRLCRKLCNSYFLQTKLEMEKDY